MSQLARTSATNLMPTQTQQKKTKADIAFQVMDNLVRSIDRLEALEVELCDGSPAEMPADAPRIPTVSGLLDAIPSELQSCMARVDGVISRLRERLVGN